MPYSGVQFVAIPEFAGIATQVGQEFSAALAEALEKAQTLTADEMEAAGYQGLRPNRPCTERLIRSIK